MKSPWKCFVNGKIGRREGEVMIRSEAEYQEALICLFA